MHSPSSTYIPGENDNSGSRLYGKGIFTTIVIRSGTPLFWDKHWARLGCDSGKVGVDLAEFPEERVLKELKKELISTSISDGRARITFLDQRSGDIWPAQTEQNTTMSILVGEHRRLPSKFSITSSPYRVNTFSPIAGVKSCNYLENLLGIEEGRDRGFHEALRINDRGELTGGCMSNVFWLKRGVLFTPHLDTGCLPGTTREYILENLPCEQTREPIDTLINAEAIFMTSAGLGVVQVHDLDGRSFDPVDHPILTLIP